MPAASRLRVRVAVIAGNRDVFDDHAALRGIALGGAGDAPLPLTHPAPMFSSNLPLLSLPSPSPPWHDYGMAQASKKNLKKVATVNIVTSCLLIFAVFTRSLCVVVHVYLVLFIYVRISCRVIPDLEFKVWSQNEFHSSCAV